jgi:FAD/FMN-containing dehydrogenase
MTEFTGDIIWRGERGYETARVGGIFNTRHPDRFPAAVLLAADEIDVQAGVRLARERGLQVTVRAGGHSWAAWSIRDDALLIDLGRMREIDLDAHTGIATVQPAVRGGAELTPFLEGHGRFFPGGHCETVGLGGFLLLGGQGWNSRKYGWGCQNVVAIDLVTADGQLVRADAEQNPDLFWAARGSGPGFFGVITRFHLKTYPRPDAMVSDIWVFGLEHLEPMLEWLHELLPTLDAGVEPVMAATRLPDLPLAPGVVRPAGPVLLVNTTALCETDEEAAEILAPLQACPIADQALGHQRGRTTLAQEFVAMTIQNPPDHRYAADSQWTDATAAELAPLLRAAWSELPTEHSFSIWYGWAPRRPLPDMAFSLEANVYIAIYAIWVDPEDDERYREWTHHHGGQLATVGKGVYIGDSDFSRRPDRFLADENFARLQEIRAQRDPDGRFVPWLISGGGAPNVPHASSA